MLKLAIPAWDIVLRTAVIYLVILIGLRLAGKHEIGQMMVFDLVVLLLIANAVQNAMVDPDTSLAGGILAAVVLLVLLVIRTRRPFFRSRPGRYLLIAALIVAGVTVVLPYSPLRGLLGFTPLPISLLVVLGSITVLYIASSEVTKRFFYARTRF